MGDRGDPQGMVHSRFRGRDELRDAPARHGQFASRPGHVGDGDAEFPRAGFDALEHRRYGGQPAERVELTDRVHEVVHQLGIVGLLRRARLSADAVEPDERVGCAEFEVDVHERVAVSHGRAVVSMVETYRDLRAQARGRRTEP